MPNQSPVRLAILEDHTLFRKLLVDFLSATPNFKIVIQSANALDLIYKLKTQQVDILLMDLFLPALEGDTVARMLRRECPDLKILVLSMCTDLTIISDLLEAGIYGYLTKGEEPDELIRAINIVSEDKIFRNKVFTDVLYRTKLNKSKNQGGKNVQLNEREIRILNLLWEEKTNREIAQELFLSVRSVEKIRQDIKEKLDVRSTVGVFKYAIDKKLIGANYKGTTLK